jgi:hypothetical protein
LERSTVILRFLLPTAFNTRIELQTVDLEGISKNTDVSFEFPILPIRWSVMFPVQTNQLHATDRKKN